MLDAQLPHQRGSAVQKVSVGAFFFVCGETVSCKGAAEKCLKTCSEVLLFIIKQNK